MADKRLKRNAPAAPPLEPPHLCDLKKILLEIQKNDTNYDARYPLVVEAMSLASRAGFKVGVRIDKEDPDWPVYCITLPTGQVSWHMPAYEEEFDGHTTEQKYERIDEFGRS